jgi:hypothetical protein
MIEFEQLSIGLLAIALIAKDLSQARLSEWLDRCFRMSPGILFSKRYLKRLLANGAAEGHVDSRKLIARGCGGLVSMQLLGFGA